MPKGNLFGAPADTNRRDVACGVFGIVQARLGRGSRGSDEVTWSLGDNDSWNDVGELRDRGEVVRWLVADTLSCPEQWFGSHLSAYSHYLREAGETVDSYCLNLADGEWSVHEGDALRRPDVIFALDRYDRCARWQFDLTTATQKTVKMVAQIAAITNPLPWNVRRADGSPAYDLVLSSIPHMVEEARAASCRAEYQPLAFDLRCRTAMMGVKRDLDCIFIGSTGASHVRRTRLLEELKDVVTVLPPVFGRDYFRTLARAKVVLNVHAEWAKGAANAMRLFEAAGLGCQLVSDGDAPDSMGQEWWHDPNCFDGPGEARKAIKWALSSEGELHDMRTPQEIVLTEHTYEHRVPRLIEWSRSL